MNTSSHTNIDKLQELFDALVQVSTSDNFEQETMHKVYLATQKKLQAKERKRMLVSILWAAIVAAGITAVTVSGMSWLREQSQSIIQLLQATNTEQILKSLETGGLWVLVIGVFIWLMSMPKKNHFA